MSAVYFCVGKNLCVCDHDKINIEKVYGLLEVPFKKVCFHFRLIEIIFLPLPLLEILDVSILNNEVICCIYFSCVSVNLQFLSPYLTLLFENPAIDSVLSAFTI